MSGILETITGSDAIQVLRKLCDEDEHIRARVLALAEAELRAMNWEEVADEVHWELELLDVEDLWDQSGQHREGYSTPEEVAWEMVEDAVRPFLTRAGELATARFPEQALQVFKGVLSGLYRFGREAETEFKAHAPDVSGECFQWAIEQWKRTNPALGDLRGLEDFIARECPAWAAECPTPFST